MKFTLNDLDKVGIFYRDTAIRQLRKPLLEAFDIYKSNVVYGVDTETEFEKAEIMTWYQDLLDKKESALINVPLKEHLFCMLLAFALHWLYPLTKSLLFRRRDSPLYDDCHQTDVYQRFVRAILHNNNGIS
jgi:hypothetical protein